MRIKPPTLKGTIHFLLAALAVYEAVQSTTHARRFVNGLAAGWHAHATIYHWVYEPKEE
jgi:hypothetical protein